MMKKKSNFYFSNEYKGIEYQYKTNTKPIQNQTNTKPIQTKPIQNQYKQNKNKCMLHHRIELWTSAL